MPDDAGFTIADKPPPETDDELIARLAKLPLLEYERERSAAAEKLGCRASILDKLVQAARGPADAAAPGQGRKLTLPRPEPWAEPVDGAALLNAIASYLAQHVFLPAGAADALAAWTLHTYSFARFRHTPRLAFTSPEKRCGKTTALDALGFLVCLPLATANISTAALFRTVELTAPALLIDEADTFLRDNEELRGAINAGHKQGGQVIRCVGDDAEPRAFVVFSPVAIAAIGRLPGTIEDRSIIVRMQRATRGERPAPLDAAAEAAGRQLASMCARWTDDHGAALADATPALPLALFNRSADNWRALFAIAEACGGDWPARLAGASAALAPDDDDEGRGVRLLLDIRTIFAAKNTDRVASAELVNALVEMEGSPWGEVNRGRPITTHALARMLRPFGISPATRRDGATTFKGYIGAAFTEAWRRYAPDAPEPADEPSHRHNRPLRPSAGDSEPSQGTKCVTVQNPRNSASKAECDDVTVWNPSPDGMAGDAAGEVSL